MSENQRLLRVDIVAPDKRVFQGYATSLRAPGVDGSFQILYNHAPMISSLNVGSLRLTLPNSEQILFATSGGFIEVIGNIVTVLAETAETVSDIDMDRARNAEQRALQRLQSSTNETDRLHAERALERARNRLRVSMADS